MACMLFMFSVSNISGFATLVSPKTTVYISQLTAVSYQLDYTQVFPSNLYRSVAVGLGYDPRKDGYSGNVTMQYGYLKTFNSNLKVLASINFDNNVTFSGDFDTKMYFSMGFMKRLSQRYSFNPAVGVPLMSINNVASIMLSFSVNYFHGSGISYKEKSDRLVSSRRKYLWFFWIDD